MKKVNVDEPTRTSAPFLVTNFWQPAFESGVFMVDLQSGPEKLTLALSFDTTKLMGAALIHSVADEQRDVCRQQPPNLFERANQRFNKALAMVKEAEEEKVAQTRLDVLVTHQHDTLKTMLRIPVHTPQEMERKIEAYLAHYFIDPELSAFEDEIFGPLLADLRRWASVERAQAAAGSPD
jgi:hypothetical protein